MRSSSATAYGNDVQLHQERTGKTGIKDIRDVRDAPPMRIPPANFRDAGLIC